jgi:NAD(P)-dependent dehydrogenase (short-subunit alcohol dehydrogenase family)
VAERVVTEGGRVAIGARNEAAGRAVAADLDALFVPTDVTDEAQAAALVEATLGEFGRLDGAFNNAGDVAGGGPLEQLAADVWRTDLEQNLTSVFYCLKAQIPAMGAGGSIVNNASIAGVRGVPGLASYTAAKHGVVGLTRSAALQCADGGPRVNAIVTGNVDTPLYRRLLDAPADRPRDELDAPNPSKRVAGPEEVAAFVAFLLSDEAAFITGAALPIDGGSTAR